MKKRNIVIYLTSIFIIFYFNCLSQTTNPFEITLNEKNNIKVKIDTISYSEFAKNGKPIKWIEPKVNGKIDSIYKSIKLNYPNSFKDSASCLVLIGLNENHVLCHDTTSSNIKNQITYYCFDLINDFILFHVLGYEEEDFILFNPQKRFIKSVWSYPNFIDTSAIFAIKNTESLDFYFVFESLTNDDFFSFYADSWRITNYYNQRNKFYFEFISLNNDKLKKYVKVTFEGI